MVVELALWDSLRNGGCRLSSAGGMTANVFHFHGCGTVTIRTAPSRNRNTAHVAAGADNAHAGLPGLAEAQREQALARWQVLRAHLEDGVPERTLRRWLAAYRAGGLASLGQGTPADAARAAIADRGPGAAPPAAHDRHRAPAGGRGGPGAGVASAGLRRGVRRGAEHRPGDGHARA